MTNSERANVRTLAGKCLCGAAQYEVTDEFVYAANCHCSNCTVCGAFLYSVVRDGAFVHVAMGTLVDDPTIRPTGHIFVGSKARWFTITDDLPQYEERVVVAGDRTLVDPR